MKLREIERLRAVAILMVMVVHWGSLQKLLPSIAESSWSGVDLFFVISGYVVALSLLRLLPPLEGEASFVDAFDRARMALKTFYTRRFFRIMPAALAVMVVFRALGTIHPQRFGTPHESAVEFFAFFGGLYNYVYPFHAHFKLGVYWSLAVEEHFYLVLPIVFVAFRTTNRRLGACVAIALVSILARMLPRPDAPFEVVDYYEKYSSHLRFDSLMAGVALALVADRAKTPPVMPRWLLRFVILPVVVLIIACLPGAAPKAVMHHVGFIALWMLSGILVAYAGQDRGYVLSFPVADRVLEHLGARSYALYLVHRLMTGLDDSSRETWPGYAALVPKEVDVPWRRVLVLFAGSLVLAEILHRTIEQPCMRLGRRVVESGGSLAPSRRTLWLLGALAALLVLFALRHPLMLALGPRNLARGAAVTVSSQEPDKPGPEALTDGKLQSELGLHTRHEESPWALVDLGAPTAIGALRVYNREDGYQAENLPLEVQASLDGKTFETLAVTDRMFTQSWPWRVQTPGVTARYLRLTVRRNTALCLSELEVFAP